MTSLCGSIAKKLINRPFPGISPPSIYPRPVAKKVMLYLIDAAGEQAL